MNSYTCVNRSERHHTQMREGLLPDRRPTLSRAEAREVYDGFALKGHIGGKDASSGYGGPAVQALLAMAAFSDASSVVDFGCGQGKLAELVMSNHGGIRWHGIDQSPLMIERASERLLPFRDRVDLQLLQDGKPAQANVEPGSVDRFVSTYCLDLLSEKDMFGVLDAAQRCLHPQRGLLLLAGITWGYRSGSVKCFFMTLLWEVLYRVTRRTVGGCRPQRLEPYLEAAGWEVVRIERTLPSGFVRSPESNSRPHAESVVLELASRRRETFQDLQRTPTQGL